MPAHTVKRLTVCTGTNTRHNYITKGTTTMKLITRTISETTYEVMCLNIKSAEVSNKVYSLGSVEFTSEAKALAALQTRYNTDDVKIVTIVNRSTIDRLYAMTEECFIRNAIAVDDVKQAREYLKNHAE